MWTKFLVILSQDAAITGIENMIEIGEVASPVKRNDRQNISLYISGLNIVLWGPNLRIYCVVIQKLCLVSKIRAGGQSPCWPYIRSKFAVVWL